MWGGGEVERLHITWSAPVTYNGGVGGVALPEPEKIVAVRKAGKSSIQTESDVPIRIRADILNKSLTG